MKNLTNQINDLDKLTAALGAANAFIGKGKTLRNDAGFGAALVAHGAIKSQSQTSIEASARGIRRLFEKSGLITSDWTTVTQRGRDLLKAVNNKPVRNLLWREAMLNLALEENGNISHPYRLMVQLVSDLPGLETSKLVLALEAKNDSAQEYARILALAQTSISNIKTKMGISDASARNAVKILPGIGRQVGDIIRKNDRSYPVIRKIATEDSLIEVPEPEYEKSKPVALVATSAANISPLPNFNQNVPTAVDLSAAIAIRKIRTTKHHKALTSLAKLLGDAGYTLYKNPFDCLAHKSGTGGVLVEMKTLDGSRSDERSQTEKALGQLRGYKHYNVPASEKSPKIIEVVAFTAQPSADAIDFLRSNSICAAWPDGNQWVAADLNGNIAAFSADALISALS